MTRGAGQELWSDKKTMSVVKSKKNVSMPSTGMAWAGAVARMRRSGGTSRAGRRAALLGMLSASYANTSRDGRRTAEGRATNAGNLADRS